MSKSASKIYHLEGILHSLCLKTLMLVSNSNSHAVNSISINTWLKMQLIEIRIYIHGGMSIIHLKEYLFDVFHLYFQIRTSGASGGK